MKNILLSLLALSVFSSLTMISLEKKKIQVDKDSSTFMYGLDHPLHSFEATAKQFKSVSVFIDESKKLEMIGVSVLVKDFDSGNSNRDSHVIETLEALKYNSISFVSQDLSYSGSSVSAKGKLYFHGVTKPMSITGVQSISGNKLSVSGKFTVDMTEFGVKPPSLVGLSTDKDIKVTFDFKYDI